MPTDASRTYDLIVAGGGPAGTAAALAGARNGLRTLVIERTSVLGGMGTGGLVSHWLGGRSNSGGEWVVGGLFRSLSEEAAARGIAVLPVDSDFTGRYTPHGMFRGQLLAGVPFDPNAMASFLDQRVLKAGVDLRLESLVTGVRLDSDRIVAVEVADKSGVHAVAARQFIDATGDADLAARSGCEHVLGADDDGFMTPVSLMFHVDGVDEQALMDYVHANDDPRFKKLLPVLHKQGEVLFDFVMVIFVKLNRPGMFMINGLGQRGFDGTDPLSRTRALVTIRNQIQGTADVLRRRFPGCSGLMVKQVAANLGVRETRRLRGPGRLTVAEVRDGVPQPDTIGLTSYGWDLSGRGGPHHQPMHGVPKPATIPIPYRILVAQPVSNLLCPGRAVNVERDVLGPLRVMAPCMAMGEAAGEAAALALRLGVSCADVPIAQLQERLLSMGAILDPSGMQPVRRAAAALQQAGA